MRSLNQHSYFEARMTVTSRMPRSRAVVRRAGGVLEHQWWSLLLLSVILVVSSSLVVVVYAFEWHVGGQSQAVDRKAMVGLWRLSPRIVETPMKEFTVYPKNKKNTNSQQRSKLAPFLSSTSRGNNRKETIHQQLSIASAGSDEPNKGEENRDDHEDDEEDTELLFMLKEDGSFQQFEEDDTTFLDDDDDSEESIDMDASWRRFHRRRQMQEREHFPLKGIWDFRDGKLILAADRPEVQKQPQRQPNINNQQQQQLEQPQQPQDTLLVGRVVAFHKTRFMHNPTQQQRIDSQGHNSNDTSTASESIALEAHLAVPKGHVKMGRFFYPKKHPSFFEQPMFQPIKTGAFSLTQILGGIHHPYGDEDNINDRKKIEKFQTQDFYNKTFLLTSHPIGLQGNNNNNRLGQSLGTNSHSTDNDKNSDNIPVNIRVMQVLFHSNNTFSSVAGLGESILRGKFDVLGPNMDQLWMKVSRFGFGRSVSGSVYSEGRMLTHEDDKGYWGTIDYEQNGTTDERAVQDTYNDRPGHQTNEKQRKLEVKGCVLFGSGLEPMPVGRFIMRETDSRDDTVKLDEDDNDENDDEDTDSSQRQDIVQRLATADLGEEGIDLLRDDNAFQ